MSAGRSGRRGYLSLMNPILILRTEIICLLLLIGLAFVSGSFHMGKDRRLFSLITAFSMVHVIMDGFTVWTSNHPDQALPWVTDVFHIVFYVSAMLLAAEILAWAASRCRPPLVTKIRIAAASITVLYLAALPAGLLRIGYESVGGITVGAGSAPAAGFLLCSLFLSAAAILLLANRGQVGKHTRMLLVPILLLLAAVELLQVFAGAVLFAGASAAVITVVCFFFLAHPAPIPENGAVPDALSGLGSRSGYQLDIEEYNAQFLHDRTIVFTFVFVGISNLRSINGLYGRRKGNACIESTAALLVSNMRQAEHIYRMSGDEFLAVYRNADEKAVVREIQRVRDACQREKSGILHPELAIGYAVSDAKYNNLREVLRVADYMMYRNKTALKREMAAGAVHENGTRLNLYGLTDRVFDAMCLTSVEFYPYITNLDTNVTRVAPAMAEFFGLGGEFIQDFMEIWLDRVHPADREGYEQDLRATLRGLQTYHFFRYRARGRDGAYVALTCRGGLYYGQDGEPDVFSGYIVNHGAPQIRDEVTGLMNAVALRERMNEAIPAGGPLTVIRMEIRNLNRARMLYGEETLSGVLRSVAEICQKALKGRGDVYSDGGRNFIFVLSGGDRCAADEVYGQVREACTGGVIGGSRIIPLDVYAGALELPDDYLKDAEAVFSALEYITEEASYAQGCSGVYFRRTAVDFREENALLLRTVHHDCLKNRNRFFLRLQPILDAQSERVTGAEALLRYESPEYGEVLPGRFIPFLESDPAYTELGYDVIRMALKHASRIRRELPDFNINVNITALQLYADDFIPRVAKILDEEGYPPERLILELTERCKEMEFTLLKQRVEEMRKAGLRVALDDMGTGFSTIDLLLHLDVNEIKLDMGFTRQMQENENDVMFAELLVKMTEQNHMILCFEGVETGELRDYLKRFGKVLLQGYCFDEPLKFEEFEDKYCRKESAGGR